MKKYILVTGASSGVGRELSIELSKKYNLIISGRNEERLDETKSLCITTNDVVTWATDLSDLESLESSLTEFVSQNEVAIEGFVHCAGVMKMVPLRAVNLQTLQETYAVNVFAPELIVKTLMSKRVNKDFLKSVVFISSNISERGAAAFSTYGSSKAALDGVMRNLAVELAPRVRVNSILPGGMITEMTKELYSDEAMKNAFEKNYPLGIGSPVDLVPMIELLLSEQGRWMTGQQITIDGGRTTDITEGRN